MNKINRLYIVVVVAAMMLPALPVVAQSNYPARTVRLIAQLLTSARDTRARRSDAPECHGECISKIHRISQCAAQIARQLPPGPAPGEPARAAAQCDHCSGEI